MSENKIFFGKEVTVIKTRKMDGVSIIPLGGLGEIGKNMTAIRCDDEICTIVWDEPYVTYAVSSKENGNDNLGDFDSKDLEVIGNIYENKELLNE